MFWNKNENVNKDWEDYLKYREEKDKRDKQFYKDYFPGYEYDENEHHTHDEHCAIGATDSIRDRRRVKDPMMDTRNTLDKIKDRRKAKMIAMSVIFWVLIISGVCYWGISKKLIKNSSSSDSKKSSHNNTAMVKMEYHDLRSFELSPFRYDYNKNTLVGYVTRMNLVGKSDQSVMEMLYGKTLDIKISCVTAYFIKDSEVVAEKKCYLKSVPSTNGARAEVTFDVPDVSFDMIQIYIQDKESYDDLVKQEDEFVNDQ